MKKFNIFLVLIATFFIGSISAKALTCTYSNGSVTFDVKDGIIQDVNNSSVIETNNKFKTELKKSCIEKIYGFRIQKGNTYVYYLYATDRYANTDEYKELKANGKDNYFQENFVFTKKENTTSDSIDKNMKCTYSDGETQIKIENGNITSSDGVNVTPTQEFISGHLYCKSQIYVVHHQEHVGGTFINEYRLYVTNYENDPYYKGTVRRFENINNNNNNSDNGGIVNIEGTVSCGHGVLKNIPSRLVKIINTIVRIIQIGIPILLIVLGMIDFGKSLVSQKEDEMKKSQRTFVSRLITAIMVFLIIFVAKVAIRFVADKSESSTVLSCVDCFISGIDRCE